MSGNKNSGKKKHKIPSVKVGLSIKGELYQDIKKISIKDGRSIPKMIYQLLSDRVKQLKDKFNNESLLK